MFALLMTILYAIFQALVVGVICALGIIFWFTLEAEVKESFRKMWLNLPQLRFHGVFLFVQALLFLWAAKSLVITAGFIKKDTHE